MKSRAKLRILAFVLSIPVLLAFYGIVREPGIFQTASMQLFSSALAQSDDLPILEPVVLNENQDAYPLGAYLELLEDPSGELTIEEVSSPEYDSQFTPSQAEVPNLGFTKSAYWVRFNLENETGQADDWLLEVGFANLHYVDLYTPMPDGVGFEVRQTGYLRPVSTRDLLYPHIVFDLDIPSQSQKTIYLRFQNGASMTLLLTLRTREAFWVHSQRQQIFNWLLFGILTAMLMYHLFLLFSLKETSYLYFVIMLASLIGLMLAYYNYLGVYFLPDLETLKPLYMPLFMALLIGSVMLFSDAFLELKSRLPKLHWVNIGFVVIWGVLILLTPFASYHLLTALMVPWSMFSLTVVLVAGIVSLRRGFHPAGFFLIAWLGMVASLMLVILVRLSIAHSSFFSENIFQLGMILMVLCWSLALADRINLLKAKTESANRELRNNESRLNQILDGMPLGVVLYGKDQKPRYTNQRTADLFDNSMQGIRVNLAANRTLAQAIQYFSLNLAGQRRAYPLEKFPIYRALQGETASADDIEMERGDENVSLEIWARPVRDEAGNVESAVVAFQDITERKKAESELEEYRKHLETLVEERTAEFNSVNELLRLRLEWLSAIVLVNQMMARSSDFTQMYEKIIEIINQLFSFHDTFIAEFNEGSRQLKILAHSCRSERHPSLTGAFVRLPESILIEVNLSEYKLAIIPKEQFGSMDEPFSLHLQEAVIKSIRLVPLQLRDQVLGYLGLEVHEEERLITDEELNLIKVFSIDIAQLIEDSRLHKQAKALITAEERNRLARDLHDSVTQVLFSITLLADVLPKIWCRDPEQGLQKLDKLQRLTRGALAEMRTMLLELRPSAIINTPLSELLAQLTEAVASRSDLKFRLAIEQIPPLPDDVQTSFYRIAQEALNNVVKHAQARNVSVSLSLNPLSPQENEPEGVEIKLVILDDGVGYNSQDAQSSHLGISIMRERASAIHAALSLDSKPGYGTQVSLTWCNRSENK
jgi:signal transduction histidine kinase